MIDFSKIKNLTIPEGEVSSISIGDKILWRKQNGKYKKELEYIENTGTQWIDTKVKVPLTVEAVIQGEERTSTSSSMVLSLNGSGRVGGWFGVTTAWGFGGTFIFQNKPEEKITVILSFTGESVSATIDGVTLSRLGEETGTLCAGSVNKSFPSVCKIFRLRFFDGDKIIHDFIPVLDLDDRPCMYDKVTDELFYNQGSGEFLYGEL